MDKWLEEKQTEMATKMGEAMEKYNHPGIYAISINNKIIYIGKSKNMAIRIINHMIHIEYLTDKSNKYLVLHQAQEAGVEIQFSVLSYCSEEELGVQEAMAIRKIRPILNYQIPKINNPRSFEVNRKAKFITLKELLAIVELQLAGKEEKQEK